MTLKFRLKQEGDLKRMGDCAYTKQTQGARGLLLDGLIRFT